MPNPQILLHLQLGLEHSRWHVVELDARLVMKHVATVIDLSAYIGVLKTSALDLFSRLELVRPALESSGPGGASTAMSLR